jgi:hypothetical protein
MNNFTYFAISILPLLTFSAVRKNLLGISILRRKVVFSYFEDTSAIVSCNTFLVPAGMHIASYIDGIRDFLFSYVIILLIVSIGLTVYRWLQHRDYIIYNIYKENALNNLIALLDKSGFNYKIEDYKILFNEGESKIIINDNKRYINISLIKCWGKKKIRILMKEFKINIKQIELINLSSNINSELLIGIAISMIEIALLIYIFIMR